MNETERPGHQGCPRCEALERRVAELEHRLEEREVAGRSDIEDGAETEAGTTLVPSGGWSHVELKALRVIGRGWGTGWRLRPGPLRRSWMDADKHIYDCPSMVAANQWGWQVLCPTDVRVIWDGGCDPSGLWVDVDPRFAPAIKSRFGQGIVTFSPPWVFRTPPGWDLLLKGPSNRWKANCAPLETVVESWWLSATLTLNWKLIEPGAVTFLAGESLGQLVPVPHGTFRDAVATEAPIGSDPESAAALNRWLDERRRIASSPASRPPLEPGSEGDVDRFVRIPVPAVEWIGETPPEPSDPA